MRFLKQLTSKLTPKTLSRPFAQVHDIDVNVVIKPLKSRHKTLASVAEELSARMFRPVEKLTMEQNVLDRPLKPHAPLVGYKQNGYCTSPKSDDINQSVAAVLSDEFLEFTASKGRDLRLLGLRAGCKWCLTVRSWRQAFDASTADDDSMVPRIYLERTSARALEAVPITELARFALDDIVMKAKAEAEADVSKKET